MFCKYCGSEIDDQAYMCIHCGMKVDRGNNETLPYATNNNHPKKKIVAVTLAIVIGYLGAHQFYLGYYKRGFLMILMTILGSCIMIGPLVTMIWSIIDAVLIIAGSRNDAAGNPLE